MVRDIQIIILIPIFRKARSFFSSVFNLIATRFALVPYPHSILISSSHKVKLREESATTKAIGMQRGYMLNLSTVIRGGGWVAKLTAVPEYQ